MCVKQLKKKESGARPGLTPLKKIPPPCYSPTKEIRSTIADVGLNFRVRNGNGCGPHSKGGGKTFAFSIEPSTISRPIERSIKRPESRDATVSINEYLSESRRIICGQAAIRARSPVGTNSKKVHHACPAETVRSGQASRAISTGQLHTLLCFHTRPIKLLVSKCPSVSYDRGDLILEWVSRLDAFSGYPIRT